ncbi:MAG: DUF3109 family protein [bacterium]
MSDNLLKVGKYSIAKEFFEQGFSSGNGPCNCSSNCCKGGVWTDVGEYELVMSKKELIKSQMDETQSPDDTKWFGSQAVDDRDFPSGKAMGTEVVNDKCAFLDKLGRCSIQLAAVADGKHRWAWKPLYCILFPVEVSDNVVGFDTMLQGTEMCCSASQVFETPLFEACKDELTHLLGDAGYSEIESHYASIRKNVVVNP